VATAAPSGLVIALTALIIFVLSLQPSGYRVDYTPPQNLATAPEKLRSPAEEKANAFVGQLAQLVADASPIVGTHFEGTKKVTDHVLDRSKFDSGQLMSLADQIYAPLKSGTPDKDERATLRFERLHKSGSPAGNTGHHDRTGIRRDAHPFETDRFETIDLRSSSSLTRRRVLNSRYSSNISRTVSASTGFTSSGWETETSGGTL